MLAKTDYVAGDGIILKPEFDVGPDLRSGKSLALLGDHAPPPTPLQLLFPPSRAQPRRVRAVADQLASIIQGVEAPR